MAEKIGRYGKFGQVPYLIKAIVPAGDLGAQIKPLTLAMAKPLDPVGDCPILDILVENLKSHGAEDFYLTVGYHAELVRLCAV